MFVRREDHGFVFSCSTVNGPFSVRLTLADDGTEELLTVVHGLDLDLPVVPLNSGSIARVLGPEYWRTFQRMRDCGHELICL